MDNVICSKSFSFAVSVVKLCQYLCSEKKEFILSKQLLRSGTSIGANIREAQHAQSKKDFISKMSIALKETNESVYWIELLIATDFLDSKKSENILQDCIELRKILTSIVKTSKF